MVTLSAKCQPHPKLGKERMLTDRRKVRAESYAAFGPDSGEEPDEVGPSQRSHRLPVSDGVLWLSARTHHLSIAKVNADTVSTIKAERQK